MTDDRTIDEFHRDRVSGSGCPDDPEGRHYFAFIDPTARVVFASIVVPRSE